MNERDTHRLDERVFIRVKRDDEWVSISIKEATEEEFALWFTKWINKHITRSEMLHMLDAAGIPPVRISVEVLEADD